MTTDKVQAAAEAAEYARAAEEGFKTDAYVPPPPSIDALGVDLVAEFSQAELARRETEQRWLMDLRQYRGKYEPDVLAKIGERRSKAFVRATRVKVKTVDARVTDLLFQNNSDRNWTAEPTPKPTLDAVNRRDLAEMLAKKLERQPTSAELDAAIMKEAKAAAQAMTATIDDQLAESRYKHTSRKVLHSGHLFGTGILKGPLVERKTRRKFVIEQGRWVMKLETYVTPFVDHVPLWNFYPDMTATEIGDCYYVWQRHFMTRHKFSGLARNRSFNGKIIRDHILAHPKGLRRIPSYENDIRTMADREAVIAKEDGLYEVLERWGYIDGDKLSWAGVEVPEHRMHETFFANVWMLPDGQVLKIVLQPINGMSYPYYLYYCDKDETSIFGDGFPAIMRDDQTMINAATRMVLDHAAITAGPQIEVNMKLLAPGTAADDIYPFKLWPRTGEDPNAPLLRTVNIDNGLEELLPIVDMFKANSDDVTAIPRYMQGENATTGAAGTASGMSMLLANASIVLKDQLTNYDEGITRPFIEGMYCWNMQFNPDNRIKGDFDIKARGTASLMAKEVRAQQLSQFASTLAPEDQKYIKREELLRQRAEAHDLTSIIKTEEEVEAEANSEAAKQLAAAEKQVQDLQLKAAQAEVALTMAKIEQLTAETNRLNALVTKTKVDTAYAAMQAGGVATERPEVAPAGDAILASAGFSDGSATTPPAPANAAPPVPEGAATGATAGIETAAIE